MQFILFKTSKKRKFYIHSQLQFFNGLVLDGSFTFNRIEV